MSPRARAPIQPTSSRELRFWAAVFSAAVGAGGVDCDMSADDCRELADGALRLLREQGREGA